MPTATVTTGSAIKREVERLLTVRFELQRIEEQALRYEQWAQRNTAALAVKNIEFIIYELCMVLPKLLQMNEFDPKLWESAATGERVSARIVR